MNKQIKCKELETILKYGLLKERISALLTDGIRADLLERMGYDTQILEFIDMEHTPKNLLIRAVRRENQPDTEKKTGNAEQNEVGQLLEFLHTEQTLNKLLIELRKEDS